MPTTEPADWTAWLDRRDPQARERLLAQYDGLAKKYATKYKAAGERAGHEWGDLYSAGRLGLCRAVDDYDPASGCRFTTFAVPKVRGAILHLIRDHNGLVRVPAWKYEAGDGAPVTVQLIEERDGAAESDVVERLAVRSALARLPAYQQRLVYRHLWVGETLAAMADSEGVTRGAMYERYRAAIVRLRRMMG